MAELIHSYDVKFHEYADDTQLYMSFKPSKDEDKALKQIQDYIAAVNTWMVKNWPKLNDDKTDKTEFIVLGSPVNLAKVTTNYIVVEDHKIYRSEHVWNIGAMFNSAMIIESQITKISQTAWYPSCLYL